jgi:hypothetical protein
MPDKIIEAETTAAAHYNDYLEAYRAASRLPHKIEIKIVTFEQISSSLQALRAQCANEDEIDAGIRAIDLRLFRATWELWAMASNALIDEKYEVLENVLKEYEKKVDSKRKKIRSASENDTAEAWRTRCDTWGAQVSSFADRAGEFFNSTKWDESLKTIRDPSKNLADALTGMQRIMREVEDESRKKKTFFAAIVGVLATLGFGAYNRIDPPTPPTQSSAQISKAVEAPRESAATPKSEPSKADEKPAAAASNEGEKPKAGIDKSAGEKKNTADKGK